MGKLCSCTKCGKPLIERLTNGTWRFLFGDKISQDIGLIVNMEILGVIRMRCIRRTCRRLNPDHWNEFNAFEINQSSSAPKID